MKSSSISIMMAAVIFAAAFAGLVFVADDASAGEGTDSTSATLWEDDGAGDYTVTFSFDGGVIVKTMAAGNTYTFTKDAVEGIEKTVKVPAGYAFKAWKDSSSGVIYNSTSVYTFTKDIVVEPVFDVKDDMSVIILTDGTDTGSFAVSGTGETTSKTYALARGTEGLSAFLKEIGLQLNSNTISISDDWKGAYIFDGFFLKEVPKDKTTGKITDVTKLTGVAGEEVVYIASFTPIYTVTFVADGVIISEVNTEDFKRPTDPSKPNFIFGGWVLEDGTPVYTYNAEGKMALVDKDFEFTADTVLYAYFEPITYSVHFLVDGKVYAERSSKYGYQIDLPTLPEGYKAWVDVDGNVVSSPVTILGETTFTAVADVYYTVNFINGELIIASVAVLENTVIPADKVPAVPADCSGWDFDFTQVITEDKDIMSIPVEYVTVTFDYGDKNFDNVTVTIVKGTTVPADQVPAIPENFPKADQTWDIDLTVPVTEDRTVTLRDNIYYTVTFMAGDDVIDTVTVLEKTVVAAPELPTGYKAWDFDFKTVITADTTIKAIAKEAVFDVTFIIEGKTPVTQKSDSISVPATAIDGKVFKGWVVQGESSYVDPATYKITEDVTFVAIYDKAPAPAGPGFFQTTTGQCTIVILVVLILAFIYAVHTNMWGLKDTLASFKLQRVKKE